MICEKDSIGVVHVLCVHSGFVFFLQMRCLKKTIFVFKTINKGGAVSFVFWISAKFPRIFFIVYENRTRFQRTHLNQRTERVEYPSCTLRSTQFTLWAFFPPFWNHKYLIVEILYGETSEDIQQQVNIFFYLFIFFSVCVCVPRKTPVK